MVSPPPRAFVTCSSRARDAVKPLLAAIEHVLLDLGWRTRVPLVASREHDLAVRRKLGRQNRDQATRATCVIHVLAPASLEGRRLDRALGHAMRAGVPILLVRADDLREQLGVAPPSDDRVAGLLALTGATLVARAADLGEALASLACAVR